MIRLKNIQKNDNIVQCDIFSEDSESEGILVFDIIADAVKKYCLPELIMWVSFQYFSLTSFQSDDIII